MSSCTPLSKAPDSYTRQSTMRQAASQAVRRALGRQARGFRSALYVPATNDKAVGKALKDGCGADCVIFDLEDAVHADRKAEGREKIRELLGKLAAGDVPFHPVVRINSPRTPDGEKDRALLDGHPVTVLVPKVEDPSDLPSPHAWAMIETPRGILNIDAIARSAGALVAGTNDLAAALCLPSPQPKDRWPLLHHLSTIVLAGRCYGAMTFDGVCTDYRNTELLEQQSSQAATMGFSGKTCIHPLQVAPVNRCFSPSQQAIDHASKVVAAWTAAYDATTNTHPGVVTVNGELVEELHVREARRILSLSVAK
eukprot:Sspe_Gene.110101::Locus_90426_Transcript_1_1_Confidence_1.000_Length_992::g.110101::m.110101/K01644/citE; citrate lyase subunit beta / citryl-CoA lyase